MPHKKFGFQSLTHTPTDSNSRNITHDQNPGGGHKHRIRITGGMGTHPTCELRISLGGDGYIDSGDITFTWS